MQIHHCPNPNCINFSAPKQKNWFCKYGTTTNKAKLVLQRFRCRDCKRTFSERTFSIDYCTKKNVDYLILLQHLISSSGINDIGRAMGISPNMVNNRLNRLAHSVLSIHSKVLEKLFFNENFVADGLESYTFSQYFPNNINIVVGDSSEFVYMCDFANLRRKGRMTDTQRRKRKQLEALERVSPKDIEYSMKRLLQNLIQILDEKQIKGKLLKTDEHSAYKRAIKSIPAFKHYLSHETTLSTLPRNYKNPLFPVNYLDRQIRKDVSDHTRETVQFAKCPGNMMNRMVIYLFYHNCIIARREKESRKGNTETHAEMAGISKADLMAIISGNLLRRAFPEKLNLDNSSIKTWRCEWRNPGNEIIRINKKIAV